jgi:predicted nucleic acid-binding Zn ribbon protein
MAARQAKGNHKDRRKLVRAIAGVLAVGEPTMFRWESWCRAKLRCGLCLQGNSWSRSDAIAAEAIRRAFEWLDVRRPPWAWGQIEYTWDSEATRLEYTHCLQCGSRLDEDRKKFCGKECGNHFRHALHVDDYHGRDRARAYLQARRDRAEPKECARCGTMFRPAKASQKFCSRECSGGRSVAEKMNGHHHPWKTGDVAANGVNGSSPITPMPAKCSAPRNANTATTTSTSPASAPRSAPS